MLTRLTTLTYLTRTAFGMFDLQPLAVTAHTCFLIAQAFHFARRYVDSIYLMARVFRKGARARNTFLTKL